MGKVLQKQFAKFVECSVDKMHHISQQFKELLRNSRKQVRLRTVNYPCVIELAGLLTTLLQWVKVLLRVQEHCSPSFSTIGHSKKHHAANSHERSASACLQDSADARTQANRPLLREKFPGRVISRNGDQNWPPRSCDLTQCNFSFFGVCEISCLCQQITNNSWAQGWDLTCLWWNWAAIMQKCHREFRQKSKSVPAESWGYICQILRSTINCSVCTLYWNKNTSTWINGAFYYKIKSCALVGTPYICVCF